MDPSEDYHFKNANRDTLRTQHRGSDWYYVAHETAFNRPNHGQQDLLWKFTIPASEKMKVLQRLDEHNLNTYSLSATDEALVRTLAFHGLLMRPFGTETIKLKDGH